MKPTLTEEQQARHDGVTAEIIRAEITAAEKRAQAIGLVADITYYEVLEATGSHEMAAQSPDYDPALAASIVVEDLRSALFRYIGTGRDPVTLVFRNPEEPTQRKSTLVLPLWLARRDAACRLKSAMLAATPDAILAPQKARLDADRTAEPLTRIVHHPPAGACIGPHTRLFSPEYETADGERIAMIAEPEEQDEHAEALGIGAT